MNIILFDKDEIENGAVLLTDHRAEHIIKILKSQPGATLKTGIINGPSGTSTITRITGRTVELSTLDHCRQPAPPPVDIVLALPRPIMLKRVLAQVATFGVGRLFLINSSRVEKSFFSATLLQPEKIKQRLLTGLEQAGDTLLPRVSIETRFRPFVEDSLPHLAKEYRAMLVAHPDTGAGLADVLPPPLNGRVLLVIGPEGGWIDFEVELLRRQGVLPFDLGPRILRVDSVIPSLLGQLDLLRRL